ncbi:Oxalate/formate antiporter [Roseomonas mucosa]|uniref:MFS transporter n=1 Tax=Roseomonas mucosa TaxID=207340 RepID=UPI0021FFC053|nr:MFS transporter [Roseomonas mucosa]QDJ07883.1 Oxalate/formate antiporter [Roseomonas mucosa]
MISTALATGLRQKGIHYGWVVAGATFLTMLATAGAMGSAGVMIEPLQQEFGWQNADISTAFALRLALFGLMGPFAAAFMNRFGVRSVILCALALISAGLLGSLVMRELWQLVLLWASSSASARG